MTGARLLFVINEDFFFRSHRLGLARAARAAGYDVRVAARLQAHGAFLAAEGFPVIPLRLRREGRNLYSEMRAVGDLTALYRDLRPTIVHHTTVKPVLYGSMAARLAGVPCVVNSLVGLGHLFGSHGPQARVRRLAVTAAYRAVLPRAAPRTRVTFENGEDRDRFVRLGIIEPRLAVVIRGMGCDTEAFRVREEPADGPPVLLFAGRLLWSKGVRDLVEAGRILRGRGTPCRVALVGWPDTESTGAIPEGTLRRWQDEGAAEWWGRHDSDMPDILAKSNVVVLPSKYGEGLPRILLEGAASGRALVATNATGCREVVLNGETGLLVPPGDVGALAEALSTLIASAELRQQMGKRGRALVEASFSDGCMSRQTLALYEELLDGNSPPAPDRRVP